MRIVVVLLTALIASPLLAQEKPKPPPRETYRYDGKSFEAWRKYCQEDLKLELKPERRIEGIHAMRAFGVNGYGAEAAGVLVDMIRTCDEKDIVIGAWGQEINGAVAGLSREEWVAHEAARAIYRIGTPASAALLAGVDHSVTRLIAHDFLARNSHR